MNELPPTNPSQVPQFVDIMTKGSVKTRSDKVLYRVCSVSGVIAFTAPIANVFINRVPRYIQYPILAIAGVAALIFITSLCLVGIKVVGRSAGKRTFLQQFAYTMLHVALFIFVPCGVITVGLMIWALMTGHIASS